MLTVAIAATLAACADVGPSTSSQGPAERPAPISSLPGSLPGPGERAPSTQRPTERPAAPAAERPAEPRVEPRPESRSATPAADAGVGTQVGAQPIAPDSLPGWQADTDLRALSGAIERQCGMKTPPTPWPTLCAEWRGRSGDLRAWIRERFVAWPLLGADGQSQGLLTGYYEPLLRGSLRPEKVGQAPLYKRPPDLLRVDVDDQGRRFSPQQTPLRGRLEGDRVVPYPTRAEIETRSLLRGHELMWIDDPVDAFFLQIQGSGRVRLRDGRIVRVGYADHNGQPYRAIGRVLLERNAMRSDEINAETIKAWLREHRDSAVEVMHSNPRFVFFRELPPLGDDVGPPGSLGIPLTPQRSIATDPRRVPPGALMYVDSRFPDSGQPLQRLVMNQDTGAAIVGPVRADFFWGFGDEAERRASLTRERVRLWVLWPRELGAPGVAP